MLQFNKIFWMLYTAYNQRFLGCEILSNRFPIFYCFNRVIHLTEAADSSKGIIPIKLL